MKKILCISAICSFFLCHAISATAQEPAADQAATETQAQTPKDLLQNAYKANDWNTAINIGNEILDKTPDDLDVLNITAFALVKAEQSERGIEMMKKAISFAPENKQLYANLCAIESEVSLESAVSSCMEATKRITDNPNLFFLTGQVLEAAKRPADARDMYEKAFLLDQANIMYVTNVTKIDFANGENEKALEITEKAVAAGAKGAILYLNMIAAARRAQKFEKAIELADTGYAQYHDEGMRVGKIEALVLLERYEEAEALAKEVEPLLHDDFAHDRLTLAVAKSSLALSCSSEQYKSCTSPTPDACCERERRALETSSSILNSEIALERDPYLAAYLGLAQILNNQYEEAESTINGLAERINRDKDNVWILAALSVALYQFSDARDRETAQSYFNTALSTQDGQLDAIIQHHPWPPRLIETLQTMKLNNDAASQQNAKTGCKCEISNNSSQTLSILAFLMFILTTGSLLVLRRKKA